MVVDDSVVAGSEDHGLLTCVTRISCKCCSLHFHSVGLESNGLSIVVCLLAVTHILDCLARDAHVASPSSQAVTGPRKVAPGYVNLASRVFDHRAIDIERLRPRRTRIDVPKWMSTNVKVRH